MNRSWKTVSEYCPHRPGRTKYDARLGDLGARPSIQIRDFQSTLDGIVAYTVLFTLLFLSSFTSFPATGLVEAYRNSLVRTGLAVALSVALIFMYTKFGPKHSLDFGP